MPESKAKLIAGQSFKIGQPYTAGHVLTEPEAHALNQTRSENIGNNMRKYVEDAVAKRDAGDASAMDNLEAAVAAYDAEYTFAMGGGGGQRLDPVEREARSLATAYVNEQLAKKGLNAKKVPEGETAESWKAKIAANIERFAGADQIIKLAQKRVGEKKKVGSALGDLS